MSFPPPGPPAGPPWAPGPPPRPVVGPPVVRASTVIDPGAPKRLARAASLGTGRLFFVFLLGVVPALLVGGFFPGRVGSASRDVPLGERVLIGALIGLGVFAVIVAAGLGVVLGVIAPTQERILALAMPPGSVLQVDWFSDRMIATTAGGVTRETLFSSINRVRVRKQCVVLDRGLGAGVLPVQVVPPVALGLLARATGRGVVTA